MVGFVFITSLCLILANPPFDVWPLAWFAFVPWMFALDRKTPRAAFLWGYLSGLVYFAGMFYWVIHIADSAGVGYLIAGLAVAALIAYLAVYWGVFAALYVRIQNRHRIAKLFLLPAAWAVLEFLRDRLFSGFGWGGLGTTQYKALPVIQIAEWTGVFGVSFLVMMVNVHVKEKITWLKTLPDWRWRTIVKEKPASLWKAEAVTALCVLFTVIYGMVRLAREHSVPGITVALVQGNVDQSQKWDEREWPAIFSGYLELTRRAAAARPDLIIWPETSFPGFIWEDPERYEALKKFVGGLKIPLLFGTVTLENGKYFNSAVLLDRDGRPLERHAKMHLVPFGEFLPLRKLLPFLGALVPMEDFTAGKAPTQFPLIPGPRTRPGDSFSVLICFEDTVAPVARKLVNSGADFLVNLTNDAWFKDTKAPLLHLQNAVFRSVENRRSLLRAANTGVTGFIDPAGRIRRCVAGKNGKKTCVRGFVTGQIRVSREKTFYTRNGDIFTLLCSLGLLAGLIKRKKNRSLV